MVGSPQINDRQAGVANVSGHLLSDESEYGQQDYWESNPAQKAIGFSQCELGLDLEQLGESCPRAVTRRLSVSVNQSCFNASLNGGGVVLRQLEEGILKVSSLCLHL